MIDLVGLFFKGTFTSKALKLSRNYLKERGVSFSKSADPKMSKHHKIQKNLRT